MNPDRNDDTTPFNIGKSSTVTPFLSSTSSNGEEASVLTAQASTLTDTAPSPPSVLRQQALQAAQDDLYRRTTNEPSTSIQSAHQSPTVKINPSTMGRRGAIVDTTASTTTTLQSQLDLNSGSATEPLYQPHATTNTTMMTDGNKPPPPMTYIPRSRVNLHGLMALVCDH